MLGGLLSDLGQWAVIDIETTGISPYEDSIIDIGYLVYEGTTLIKKYNSLTRDLFSITPNKYLFNSIG